jgi:hypothetical protein
MNHRAAGGTRAAPPAPLIVAADAPAAMQSDTPASAAETPEIQLVVPCASEDKEVCTIWGSIVASYTAPSPQPPPLPLSCRTSTQTPALNPSACQHQGDTYSCANLNPHHSRAPPVTASHCKSSSKSPPTPAMRRFSCLTRLSTPPPGNTSATTSKTCADRHMPCSSCFASVTLAHFALRCGRTMASPSPRLQRCDSEQLPCKPAPCNDSRRARSTHAATSALFCARSFPLRSCLQDAWSLRAAEAPSHAAPPP